MKCLVHMQHSSIACDVNRFCKVYITWHHKWVSNHQGKMNLLIEIRHIHLLEFINLITRSIIVMCLFIIIFQISPCVYNLLIYDNLIFVFGILYSYNIRFLWAACVQYIERKKMFEISALRGLRGYFIAEGTYCQNML